MYVSTTLLVSLMLQQASILAISSVGSARDGDEYDKDPGIFEINKDLNLTDGDIILSTGRDRNSILGSQLKWEIPVPYVLDKSLDLNAKGVILRAFDQIRLKTCIDFKPWEDEPNHILIIKDNGCWSYVGNQRQGIQRLSIGLGCDHHAIVEHELLHALGFWHEQSRHDRDKYVNIVWENIIKGREPNFYKHSATSTATHGTTYDYASVMHYGKDDFTNGNGLTIRTHQVEYQYLIGQRIEMSSIDVLKLQKLYNCTSAVTFVMSCSFEDDRVCNERVCAAGNSSWERVGSTRAGPLSDHTRMSSEDGGGSFMHCSTAYGEEGDGAKMQSRKMKPKKQLQCLQFFYFRSGSDKDQLNIWIREKDRDAEETTNLMGQITGPPTSHWQLGHIHLNATRPFQLEFEVRKGPGNSSGGFSVDDVNVFETECPQHVWHIPDFDYFLKNSSVGTTLLSPRFRTKQSYGVQLLLHRYARKFGVFFRLVSTDGDDQLQWPCAWRQVTVSLLDQSPSIQQQMSKQISFTTDSEKTFTGDNGETFHYWDDPRKVGHLINDTSGDSYYAGPSHGYTSFLYFHVFWSGNYIKEGSVFFLLDFKDLTTLRLNGSDLPKPQTWSGSNHVTLLHTDDEGACLNQLMGDKTTTPVPPPTTSSALSLPTGTKISMVAASVAVLATNLPVNP